MYIPFTLWRFGLTLTRVLKDVFLRAYAHLYQRVFHLPDSYPATIGVAHDSVVSKDLVPGSRAFKR